MRWTIIIFSLFFSISCYVSADTVIINTPENEIIIDMYVFNFSSQPSSAVLHVTYLTGDSGNVYGQDYQSVALAKFNISKIPDDAVIANAEIGLNLTTITGSCGIIMVEALTNESWNQFTSWNDIPEFDGIHDDLVNVSVNGIKKFSFLNVTPDVMTTYSANGNTTSYIFYGNNSQICTDGTNYSYIFHSSESQQGSSAEIHMRVNYTKPYPNMSAIPIIWNGTVYSNDSLQGECIGFDWNNASLNYYWKWFNNSILHSEGVYYGVANNTYINVSTLGPGMISAGDQWRFSCLVSDGIYNASVGFRNSSLRIIYPSAPVAFASVNDTIALSNESLQGWCNSSDVDGNKYMYYSWIWYNGSDVGIANYSRTSNSYSQNVSVNIATLPFNYTKTGEMWTFSCNATDGDNSGIFANSSSIGIFNSSPVLSNVNIDSVEGYLNCTFDVTDADGDAFLNYTLWYNGSVLIDSSYYLLGANNYTLGDSIVCNKVVSDGYSNSTSLNSSVFVADDVTSPTYNNETVSSDVFTSVHVSIRFGCYDVNVLYSGFPKVQWENPNSVVEGNFSMVRVSEDFVFEKNYTFSIVGVYTNFIFYCADGSGNELVSSYGGVLSSSVVPVEGGGGSGGGTITDDKNDCDISIVPLNIVVNNVNRVSRFTITNNEDFSVIPTLLVGNSSIISGSFIDTSSISIPAGGKTEVIVSNKYLENDTVSTFLTVEFDKCYDVVVPVEVTGKEGFSILSFADFYGNLKRKLLDSTSVGGLTISNWVFVVIVLGLFSLLLSTSQSLTAFGKIVTVAAISVFIVVVVGLT